MVNTRSGTSPAHPDGAHMLSMTHGSAAIRTAISTRTPAGTSPSGTGSITRRVGTAARNSWRDLRTGASTIAYRKVPRSCGAGVSAGAFDDMAARYCRTPHSDATSFGASPHQPPARCVDAIRGAGWLRVVVFAPTATRRLYFDAASLRRTAPDLTALVSLLTQHPVDRRTTHTQCRRNRARRVTARMHPPSQSGFRLVERFGSPDGLAACSTRFTCCCTAFATKLQFKFGQAG